MGISLSDRKDSNLSINFWHWRTIVEIIRELKVLDENVVDGLNEPFCGNKLSKSQALLVAEGIELNILPGLTEPERILIDGSKTKIPDDLILHPIESPKFNENYSTNMKALVKFVNFCKECEGFEVN